jgi:hypothetical protein
LPSRAGGGSGGLALSIAELRGQVCGHVEALLGMALVALEHDDEAAGRLAELAVEHADLIGMNQEESRLRAAGESEQARLLFHLARDLAESLRYSR